MADHSGSWPDRLSPFEGGLCFIAALQVTLRSDLALRRAHRGQLSCGSIGRLVYRSCPVPGGYRVGGEVSKMKNTALRGRILIVGLMGSYFAVQALAQDGSRDVLVGSSLTSGFDMGVNSSGGKTDWLKRDFGQNCLKMSYPYGQSWGAVLVTVGMPKEPPRPYI